MQKAKAQQGFTLIELVVVIVLLGILGVTALAQFQDLSGDAQDAANQGVAAELSSAGSINYAARSLNASSGSAVTAATNCDATATSIMAIKPSDYTFSTTTACVNPGDSMECSVSNGGTAATAVVICIN